MRTLAARAPVGTEVMTPEVLASLAVVVPPTTAVVFLEVRLREAHSAVIHMATAQLPTQEPSATVAGVACSLGAAVAVAITAAVEPMEQVLVVVPLLSCMAGLLPTQ